jgi:hypothetical protein
MTNSNSETTPSSSPNGQDSFSRRLLSALWQWIKSYGGLSDLKNYNKELKRHNEELKRSNAELRKETDALRQQNVRLAELESKLDIVLFSSDPYSLIPQPTDDS